MKILVLHCGGTISCEEINGALTPSASIEPSFREIQKELRGISFRHKKLTPFLSEYLNGAHITKIIKEAKKAVLSQKYGGIIVTHGSDTVAYTAAALAYALGNESIPVVTVCADLPLSDPRSSGHVNLRAAALLIASERARGVFAVYRDTDTSASVHRATRLLRHRTYEAELSSSGETYGKVVSIAPANRQIRFSTERAFIKNALFNESKDELFPMPSELKKTSPVAYFTVSPGMKYPTPARNCRAVILGSYHSGTVDTSSAETLSFAKLCKRRGISVFVDGTGANADYESMKKYGELGFNRLPPLSSPVAMYMKLWFLIESGETELAYALGKSLGGDILPSK